MRMLRNTPIKRKLLLIGMLTSGVALLFACGAFITYEQLSSRNNLVKENLDAATLVGNNNTAALTFNDAASATASLRSLSNDAAVTDAAIYDKEGNIFAVYHSTRNAAPPPPVEHNTHRFDKRGLALFADIKLDGETIGAVYIRHDLSETLAVQRHYVIIAALVMLAALFINWLISSRLYRIISEPITHLSAVMEVVTTEKNYSLCAVKQGNDELGGLIDGFNEMLKQIQQRDCALQEARDDLERRVEQRTRELANSLSLLNATLESTTDGIIAIDTSGERLCANSRVDVMWGRAPHVGNPKDRPRMGAYIAEQLKDPDWYWRRRTEMYAHMERDYFDVLELKDGRFFERYVKPQRVDGKIVGRVVNFRDITVRRRAEQELENAHRQLLETSRQAGMAEVASNVLHNVGNVLNSVNVSANLVAENMKRSKVASLGKVAGLLQDHAHDLAAFITDDPKGKHLPGFLAQLTEHLLGEQRDAVKELECLRGNIDHIKEIVTMQQSYSKVSGIKEQVSVIDLIEDTLRMNDGALQRHGVTVVREFEAVPTINTEKHKILQILVNLVRNAKYACSESERADKRVTLRVQHDDTSLRIAVIDNGVGISAENMTRIFGHGFTTRKDGHGFGLHSGALAARELGGALHVHSDGPGKGATFTLELPLQRETAHA